MTETTQTIRDQHGNPVARVVYSPTHPPNTLPYWLEVADGYTVEEARQQEHDRTHWPRLPVVRR